MSFKVVKVNNYSISAEFVSKIIRIRNNATLKNMLKNTSNGSGLAATKLKEEYRNTMGKSIDISVHSLGVEILGHVYPDKVAHAVKKIPLISHLADKIISHTDVIDCGEKSVDNNRWIWDALAPFHEAIAGEIVS